MKKKDEVKDQKKDLIFGLLYLVCSFLWIGGGVSKIIIKESYLLDMVFGILLLILAIIYLVKYKKRKK